ncbi:MAG TPA: hypothetical protein VED66_17660 [Candidatus Sulfotelmatobacter sp.]|nr:hypothetical protein [Candidatus Sulfotelmatobacter sp.]
MPLSFVAVGILTSTMSSPEIGSNDPGNIARDSLRPILKQMGRAQIGARFNMFRRFREAVLQQ